MKEARKDGRKWKDEGEWRDWRTWGHWELEAEGRGEVGF